MDQYRLFPSNWWLAGASYQSLGFFKGAFANCQQPSTTLEEPPKVAKWMLTGLQIYGKVRLSDNPGFKMSITIAMSVF